MLYNDDEDNVSANIGKINALVNRRHRTLERAKRVPSECACYDSHPPLPLVLLYSARSFKFKHFSGKGLVGSEVRGRFLAILGAQSTF